MLRTLPEHSGALLKEQGIDAADYPIFFRSAVESLRGTSAASGKDKRRFLEAVLDHMKDVGSVKEWEFLGGHRRQDYRVILPNGRAVGIESKGGPDGNNMGIWELPAWADEFVIWCQNPESLAVQPGKQLWSGLSIRTIPRIIQRNEKVDALVFFDGRCGSEVRRCPKGCGVQGDLREKATSIEGQDGLPWLPPPCIYLLPRQIPHAYNNPEPPLHDLETCQFAKALLTAFNIPAEEQRSPAYIHWAKARLEARPNGRYLKVTVGSGLDNPVVTVGGNWKRYRGE